MASWSVFVDETLIENKKGLIADDYGIPVAQVQQELAVYHNMRNSLKAVEKAKDLPDRTDDDIEEAVQARICSEPEYSSRIPSVYQVLVQSRVTMLSTCGIERAFGLLTNLK
jgi:hypothetical protein